MTRAAKLRYRLSLAWKKARSLDFTGKKKASLTTRSEFLSRISHEIRNPMNSIIGMADILKSTRLNYEQQQYVDNLLRSGHALLDMLNNLIDFSSIEGGKLTLKPGPFDLFASLDRCLHLIALQAHHKNLNVYVSLSPAVVNQLEGDSVRLEQVLINLLNNAVKFTEHGQVRLGVDVQSQTATDIQLLFSVEDSGIGIKREQLGEIFESFVQADSSIQRRYGGSGLGLSISSELIRLMGGHLQVSSQFGQGSRFYFSITLAKQNQAVEHPQMPLSRLQERGFAFLTATPEMSVYEGIFTTLRAPADILANSQDLKATLLRDTIRIQEILIDDSVGIISMINCRNTADQHGLGDRTVALMRSNFTKENMDLLRRNGFTRFLIKPLRPWEILDLPEQTEAADVHGAGKEPFLSKLKEKNLRVLLVDDSNDNLFLLKEVVQPLASTIHFAENGLDALDKFHDNKYDVVFMDIQMPVMDGYTAIRKMRQMETAARAAHMPIFAVTAHAGLVDAQKCREAGFTDRIVKPVVRSDIYNSLSKAFGLDLNEPEKQDSGEFSAGEPLPARYLERLIPIFLKTRFDDMEKMKVALQAEDFKAVAQIGHKIKGSAASYGFNVVSERARELESEAKSGHLQRCEALAAELVQIFQEEQKRRSGADQPISPA
jgi:two-component system sensor histidine kinase/response regulator